MVPRKLFESANDEVGGIRSAAARAHQRPVRDSHSFHGDREDAGILGERAQGLTFGVLFAGGPLDSEQEHLPPGERQVAGRHAPVHGDHEQTRVGRVQRVRRHEPELYSDGHAGAARVAA